MVKKVLSLFVVSAILMSCFVMVPLANEEVSTIVADPGANVNIFCGFEVQLDGSNSEADEVITSYSWRFISKAEGSTATLSDASSAVAKFYPDVLGEYVVGLSVSDGTTTSEEKTVVVRAKPLDADTDDIDLKRVAGPMNLNYTFENAIPLSDGWLITADRSNKVLIVNVLTGQIGKSFQLSAAPSDMAIDFEKGLLLVTMSGASRLAKIDICGGTVSYIELPSAGSVIEKADSGRVFVCVYTRGNYTGDICVVDYTTDTIVSRLNMGYYDGNLYAFNAKYNYLYVANSGISAATISRYSYDPQTGVLAFLASTTNLGSNGQDVRVSPDGEHLIFCCGGGNAGYTIFDIDPHDFSKRFGAFDTGAYPRSGWFSLDSKYFLGTNYDKIMLFDVETHALLSTFPVNSDQGKVYFSRGSKLIYWFNGEIGLAFKTYIDDGTPVDIDSLEVLGYDIGFSRSTTSYIVITPAGTKKVPKIIVDANEMFDVKITYPPSLPGRATVTVGACGTVRKTYNISFVEVSRLSVSISDLYFMATNDSVSINPYVYFNDGTGKSIANTAKYTSSNEAVAVVDESGRLQATARGYSKITVEVYGVTKSIDVYVDVNVDHIAVEGYDISFTPSKTYYSITLPAGATSAPKVDVEYHDAFDVAVSYPPSLPGTVTVTVGAAGVTRRTYSIYCIVDKAIVAPVNASHESGEIDKGTEVSLFTETVDASIYYSVNYSDYYLYTTPIIINQDTVLKAYATKSGMSDSSLSEFRYTVIPDAPNIVTTVSVPNTNGTRGQEVEVDVTIQNNPGIAAFVFNVDFGKELSLISVEAGDIIIDGNFLSGADEGSSMSGASSVKVTWLNLSDIREDGTLFTLKFKVGNNVHISNLPITVSYVKGNVINENRQEVEVVAKGGYVQVSDIRVYGDVTGDGTVDSKDALKLHQFLADMPITFTEDAWISADVNGDGVVDIKDGQRMAQYLAGWTVKFGN